MYDSNCLTAEFTDYLWLLIKNSLEGIATSSDEVISKLNIYNNDYLSYLPTTELNYEKQESVIFNVPL